MINKLNPTEQHHWNEQSNLCRITSCFGENLDTIYGHIQREKYKASWGMRLVKQINEFRRYENAQKKKLEKKTKAFWNEMTESKITAGDTMNRTGKISAKKGRWNRIWQY